MILSMISYKPEDRATAIDICEKLIRGKQFFMEGIELTNL